MLKLLPRPTATTIGPRRWATESIADGWASLPAANPMATGAANSKATRSSSPSSSFYWPSSESTTTRVCVSRPTTCAKQLPDGGWSNYPGGPTEVSVSVKAYFALKIAGDAAERGHMARATTAIRDLGGAEEYELLHALLPRVAGPAPLLRLPVGPGGIDAPAAVVFLQHLRDVGLEPHHLRARSRSWTRTSR